MFSGENITQIVQKIIDAERERGAPLEPEEVGEAICKSRKKAKRILSLLEEMGVVEMEVRTTDFAESLRELPTNEPEEKKQIVVERTDDLLGKIETIQESAHKERAEREIDRAKDQVARILQVSESGDYGRALTLVPTAYKYLSDAMEALVASLPSQEKQAG